MAAKKQKRRPAAKSELLARIGLRAKPADLDAQYFEVIEALFVSLISCEEVPVICDEVALSFRRNQQELYLGASANLYAFVEYVNALSARGCVVSSTVAIQSVADTIDSEGGLIEDAVLGARSELRTLRGVLQKIDRNTHAKARNVVLARYRKGTAAFCKKNGQSYDVELRV